ncbi:MAG TPA: exodeoxyribonuclease V subunit gamma [Phycisphaerae bacterium]|nr:exodeoxyribonuclease V subunit gamma [Phycisphaerae bacterium]HRY68336.1 exodeoxyribonuclease V subunit gamma [Phycisphaerae bacterium]HSA26781.1 exodeoxyribonuclease V subunit gamma [Phycisphaerae bacterium]
MSVRFVVGRAGSGKTWRCLEAVRERLRADAAEGNRLLLLVPEQASFQMERGLIETPDLPGFTRCEVLSFQRLAYRIFAETGADPRCGDRTIGRLGRQMAIRRLIHRERARLRLLDRVADKSGLVRQVAAAIDELMREQVEPSALTQLAEGFERENPLGAAKLGDLARLYQAYLAYLQGDRMDPAQYLNLAAERLPQCTWLDGAEVWVDGFAGFTGQEVTVLVELARRVAAMEIALLVNPAASAVQSDSLPGMTASLFARTERTMVRLRKRFREAGVAVDEPVRLSDERPPRFRVPELARLEECLCLEGSRAEAGWSSTGAIRVLELPDRRSEVEAAVAEIQRLTRAAVPPMRYRDVAVIVRDMGPYHDLLSAALRAQGIPCFIDRRRPTTYHPLIELVRALLAVATDHCRLDSIRLTLKTGLLPISPDDADLLENYLLAQGINGRASWSETWTGTRMFKHKDEQGRLGDLERATIERINGLRRCWLALVGPWLDVAATGKELDGRVWAAVLFERLDAMKAAEALHGWADRAQAAGDADEAQMHRQVWADFVELLDEYVKALGSERMRIGEVREAIEAGLAEFDIGLAPPTLDQVLVGAIERSRHPSMRATILLGFDRVHFPRRRSEDPLLGDAERESLEKAGVEVGFSRRRQMRDERMLAYIALTRASEYLWISYPRADADGSPVQPSPFLESILKAVPGLEVEKIGDPRMDRSVQALTQVRELGGRLAVEFRYRVPRVQEADEARRREWNALYEAARNRPEWSVTLRQQLAGLGYRNDARLRAGMVQRAVRTPFVGSVSELELYAACPFAHYARYFLRLDSRAEAELAQVDVGVYCHAIMEEFIGLLAKSGTDLADLEDADIEEGITAAANKVEPVLADQMMLEAARHAFLAGRHRGYMARVTRWQRDFAKVGRFRPWRVELSFGYQGAKDALILRTPKGREIQLRGRIDRVDLADLGDVLLGLVVDYKTTDARYKKLDLTDVYHGLALQLVGYLLVLRQRGHSLAGRPIQPAAAFYLPLLEGYQSVKHPSEEKAVRYLWRGIADVNGLDSLDGTARANRESGFLAAQLTGEGRPYASSDLVEPDGMEKVLSHVGRRMGELADDLLDGRIEVHPYWLRRQRPCRFCDFAPFCRFEVSTQPMRVLQSFRKPAALDAMKGGGSHGS